MLGGAACEDPQVSAQEPDVLPSHSCSWKSLAEGHLQGGGGAKFGVGAELSS